MDRRIVLKSFASTTAFASVPVWAIGADAVTPHFIGQINVTFGGDGRHMTLLDPYAYVDSNSVEWTAPKGTETDGASIPQWAWSFIGGPFEGLYRGPAVLHDFYCDKRSRPWQDTDRMFYNAMITAGVDQTKARVMYAAVVVGGPRWDAQTINNTQLTDALTGLSAIPQLTSDEKTRVANVTYFLQSNRAVNVEAPYELTSVKTTSQQDNEKRADRLADFVQADWHATPSGTLSLQQSTAVRLAAGSARIVTAGPTVVLNVPAKTPTGAKSTSPDQQKKLARSVGEAARSADEVDSLLRQKGY